MAPADTHQQQAAGQRECKRLVSGNAIRWSSEMQLRRAHASGNAEPSRSRGLSRESPKSETCNGDSRHFCRHAAGRVRRGLSLVSPLSPNQLSLHLGSYFRLLAASGERSPYRHDFVVSGLIDRRCRQVASGRFLDVLTPPSHHRTPAFNIVRSVVGAADFVLVDMRQRDFDQLRIPPMLVQDGAGHGAHAMADQAVLEAHAFQRHVGGLAIGVGAWISI